MTYSVLWNPSDLGYLTVWAGKEVAEGKKFEAAPKVDGLDAKIQWLPDQKHPAAGRSNGLHQGQYWPVQFLTSILVNEGSRDRRLPSHRKCN